MEQSSNTPKYNVYVGARYVPKFDGAWDNTKQYEPLTIVEYKGASYTSKTFVPVGEDIYNEFYWVCTGNYNAQVEAYRQECVAIAKSLEAIKNQVDQNTSNLADLIDAFNKHVTANNTKFAEIDDEINKLWNEPLSGRYPIIGGTIAVSQVGIRSATDGLTEGGNYPTSDLTNQGSCVIYGGNVSTAAKAAKSFAFAKRRISENKSDIITMNADYTYAGRGQVNATVNGMCYVPLELGTNHINHGGYIFCTAINEDKSETRLLAVRNIDLVTDKKFFEVPIGENPKWAGNVGWIPENNTLIGIDSASPAHVYTYNLDTDTYKVGHVVNKKVPYNPDVSKYDVHQGGCYARGYYFALGFRCIHVFKIDLQAENDDFAQFVGDINLPLMSVEGIFLQEVEDISWDEQKQTMYLTSTIYDSADVGLLDGTTSTKINNAIFVGECNPFTSYQKQVLESLNMARKVYVKDGSPTSLVYQDGSSNSPFNSLLAASSFLMNPSQIDCSGYTVIPEWGDTLKSWTNANLNVSWGDSEITLNGSLVIKDCNLEGNVANFLRLNRGTKGTEASIPFRTLTLRRCKIDHIILIQNTGNFQPSEFAVYADGYAQFRLQGTYANFDENTKCKASSTCRVGSDYIPVYGGTIGQQYHMQLYSSAGYTDIPTPQFEDTKYKCVIYFVDSNGNLVIGYPSNQTMVRCTDGTSREITRNNNKVTIANTEKFEHITLAPLSYV